MPALTGPVGVKYTHNTVYTGALASPSIAPANVEVMYALDKNGDYAVHGNSALGSQFDYQITEALKDLKKEQKHENESNLPAIREPRRVDAETGMIHVLPPEQMREGMDNQKLMQLINSNGNNIVLRKVELRAQKDDSQDNDYD
jgi:hypothetical protein